MMRHLHSAHLGDLAAFYEQDVELVSIARPSVHKHNELSRQLLAGTRQWRAQWVQTQKDLDAADRALGDAVDAAVLPVLRDEIASAVEALTDLLDCSAVGIRAQRLRGPMCPRFHVDRVVCRMLITLAGEGTEWIPHDSVDWALFEQPGAMRVPASGSDALRRTDVGAWSLLKGGNWDGRFRGVVHRSPHIEQDRVLLSLDPLFSDAD